VTTNNDTPQVFSDGASDDGPFGGAWRDEAGAAPYGSWFGWDQRDEAGGQPGEPEYPSGPGFAPLPADEPGYPGSGYPGPGYPGPGYPDSGYPEPGYPGPGEPGYPAGPGYAPDSGYAHDLGYPHDGWNVPDAGYGYSPEVRRAPEAQYLGYAPEPDYGRAAGVPPMESLSGAGAAADFRSDQDFRTDRDSWSEQDAWGGPAAGYGQPAGRVPPPRSAPPGTADRLTPESLLHGNRSAAGSGWRHRVYRVTGGLLRLGESAADLRRRDLINRVRTPVAGGHHRVAVLSLKGGVGKTTTAVGLGATFATLRGDRVIAVDANPDRGTLSDKVRLETAATVRDLLNERDQIYRYADVRAFTTQAPSRLEVLASDRDPGVSVAFGADDYCDAARVLEHFYSICLTDCGTGLLHSAMSGVLRLADQIVVVSSPSVDGARSASATLDWLEAHQCGDLVRNGVVVLSTIRPKSKSTVDLDRLEQHFAARCRAVARIPYDPHLEEGAEVELELLSAETADAYLTLAALVGDGLAWPRR
jgi:MinD-like ATPase involved in chromosome partitioning or flagellar assembly